MTSMFPVAHPMTRWLFHAISIPCLVVWFYLAVSRGFSIGTRGAIEFVTSIIDVRSPRGT